MIAKACKKVIPYIDYFIKIGYVYQEDLKFYFDRRPFRNLVPMDEEEFGNMTESILFLE